MQDKKEMLVVANWKMNPRTIGEAQELLSALKKEMRGVSRGRVVIVPPFPYLAECAKAAGRGAFLLGAQNIASEKLGASTGEVAASMVESLGVSHVIIGHSERRARGETDEDIERKTELALKSGVTAIVCVGERMRDASGKYFGVVETQVRSAVRNVPVGKLLSLVIAYEPVWAISTARDFTRPATPDDAHEMFLFIRKILTDIYGRASAHKVRLLYGGSVDQKNIRELVDRSGAEGFLVGGASLRPKDFGTLVQTVYGT